MNRRIVPALLLAMLCVCRLGAQSSVGEQTSALTHRLMSPFCPELLLADCPSTRAGELRAEIAQRFAAGESATAIEDDIVARFGSQIRTEPEFKGIGALAWIGPPLAGIAGIVFVAAALRSVTHHGVPDGAGSDTGDSPDDRAIGVLACLVASACGPRAGSAGEGRVLFNANGCLSCHGPEDRGDGPVAARLGTPPRDLPNRAAFQGGRSRLPTRSPTGWARSAGCRRTLI